jgi:hypothetical protein
MSENYPVQDILEQAINKQVNALVGNNDVNLNTIIKMSLMNEYKQVNSKEMEDILARISSNNQVEKYYVDKEYEMTIDCDGNIVPVNSISNAEKKPNCEGEKDTGSIIPEPEGSE